MVLITGMAIFHKHYIDSGYKTTKDFVQQEPLDTYIGGACTCPPSDGMRLEVVNLYSSKGESIEKIKQEARNADCSQFGCAMAKEYKLYP